MRKDECRLTRSCSSAGSSLDLSHAGSELRTDVGDEDGVSCWAGEDGELESEGVDDGSVRDSRRERAPLVGVSVVLSANRTRLRGVMGRAAEEGDD